MKFVQTYIREKHSYLKSEKSIETTKLERFEKELGDLIKMIPCVEFETSMQKTISDELQKKMCEKQLQIFEVKTRIEMLIVQIDLILDLHSFILERYTSKKARQNANKKIKGDKNDVYSR
jgi:hypothetical protein